MNNDINEKITIAKETLNRTLEFIKNCDSKTTTVLSVTGIIFTLLCSDGAFKNTIEISFNLLRSNNIFHILLAITGYISFITFSYGIYKLSSVLLPRINLNEYKSQYPKLTEKSLIFFNNISSISFEGYEESFNQYTKESYLNDLLSQVYLNCYICDIKFKNYTTGLQCTKYGSFALLIVFVIYIFIKH